MEFFKKLFGKQKQFKSVHGRRSLRSHGKRSASADFKASSQQGMSDEFIGEMLGLQLVKDSAIEHLNRAQKYTEDGDHHKTIKECLSAIAIEPNYVDAYVALGTAYFSLGRCDDAIKTYTDSLLLVEKYTPQKKKEGVIERVLVNICSTLRAKDHKQSAIEEFSNIVSRLKNPPPMHHACLGILHEELDQNDKAKTEYKKLLTSQKSGPWSDLARDKLK